MPKLTDSLGGMSGKAAQDIKRRRDDIDRAIAEAEGETKAADKAAEKPDTSRPAQRKRWYE